MTCRRQIKDFLCRNTVVSILKTLTAVINNAFMMFCQLPVDPVTVNSHQFCEVQNAET